MENPKVMNVLDGYRVEIFPGDKYANAHLFVRATYAHAIHVTDTEVTLRDASVFDGARTRFNDAEAQDLRTLMAEVRAAEAQRQAEKKTGQALAARRSIAAQQQKIADMETAEIFD